MCELYKGCINRKPPYTRYKPPGRGRINNKNTWQNLLRLDNRRFLCGQWQMGQCDLKQELDPPRKISEKGLTKDVRGEKIVRS